VLLAPRMLVELEWPAACCFEPAAAMRAACQTRAMPRKETRPKALLIKLAIIPRAWSFPWQHPKRSRLIDPFSAQSRTNCLTLRESSPRAPTTRPVVGGNRPQQGQHYMPTTGNPFIAGPGGHFRTYSTPLNSRSALRALTSQSVGTSAARISAACPRATELP